MANLNLVILLLAAVVCNVYVLGASRCPPKNWVNNSKPVCYSDKDCSQYGKVCCPNSLNTKSCTTPGNYNNGSGASDKYGNSPVNCGGVKCMPYEVCKPDPVTKRPKCQRP